MEIWKPIPGYRNYSASSSGRIHRHARSATHPAGRMMTLRPTKRGYLQVCLCENGIRRSEDVHRLICLAFRGPAPAGAHAAHKNGRKADNRKVNLSWKTPKKNCADKKRHGTHQNGEKIGNSKLTAQKVRRIRRLCAAGKKQADVAAEYHVDKTNISCIVRRKTWRHI